MREAVVVSAVRTAVGKAPKGMLKDTRPEDVAAMVVQEALSRAAGLKVEEVEDIVLGCAFPESDQGLNLGRVVAMRAGFPFTVPGQTVNRFCSSGLQAIATAAYEIMVGAADVMIAGGVEFMSQVPIMGLTPSPNPYLVDHNPQAYTSMGLTAENVAERFGISREDQDRFALSSHQKAARAIKEGKFKEEILPVPAKVRVTKEDGTVIVKEVLFDTDEGVRYDASLEGMAGLKPVFKAKGTVTAGNSSQTSDGAAALVLMSKEKATSLGLKPMAAFRSFAVAGVPPEVMGIGPVFAAPKAIKKAGLKIGDIGLIELNEAFASQALYVIRELGLNPEIVNVNGGAIAVGHPLGCTGAKLTTNLLYEMKRRNVRYGLVTMCIGGGMGAAGVFERTD
ncbi:MAG: acetyl-CoA acetyltransferase [Deltaproteobacteria bacterium RBG_16_49_23]|nr:MAG: acetyl-CoA acetyltransferase [Deltaproteobacteria bacterium RBG_16_49_23]